MDGTFQREMLQYLIQDKVDIDIDRSLLSPGVDDDEEDDDDGMHTVEFNWKLLLKCICNSCVVVEIANKLSLYECIITDSDGVSAPTSRSPSPIDNRLVGECFCAI